MKDTHVHIGQFHEIYYSPVEILRIVMEKCTDGLCFSSTTTCKENVKYTEIENEISRALTYIPWPAETVSPFFWYAPAFATQGVAIEKAMWNLPYKGIKLHPLAHTWDLTDKKTVNAAHELFGCAGQNKLPVLIHTGRSGVDAADIFSRFFPLYPETKIILAHLRPLDTAIVLLHQYPNVYGDTAFLPETDFRRVLKEGLSHKIFFGSDFPVTSYFSNKYPPGNIKTLSLQEQYAADFQQLQPYRILGAQTIPGAR